MHIYTLISHALQEEEEATAGTSKSIGPSTEAWYQEIDQPTLSQGLTGRGAELFVIQ